jgi:thymidylate synthase
MIIFAETADEAWISATRMILQHGKPQMGRRGESLEVLHAHLAIQNPLQRWVLSRTPAINPAFAIAEAVWIVSGRNDARFLNHWNPKLPFFAGNTDQYPGAYGHRLRHHFGIDQIARAVETLSVWKESCQVVLQIWDPRSDFPRNGQATSRDIPCNTCSFLKIRDERLEWMQVMRSNDLFLGLPYNLVQFTVLQELIAGWVGVEIGAYHHISDSLHGYMHNVESIRLASHATPISNKDSLRASWDESFRYFRVIEAAMTAMIEGQSNPKHYGSEIEDASLPSSYANLWRVVAADDARRRGNYIAVEEIMQGCSNPALTAAWLRWAQRKRMDKPLLPPSSLNSDSHMSNASQFDELRPASTTLLSNQSLSTDE